MTTQTDPRQIGPRTTWQITPSRTLIEDSDLVSVPVADPQPGSHHLTNHGGATMPNPKLVIIDFGPWWGDATKRDQFAADLMTAGYLQPLADLGYGSGNGQFLGSFRGQTLSGEVTQQQIEAALNQALASIAGIPQPDGSTLYALLTPADVVFNYQGEKSCSSFCGIHLSEQGPIYSVQTATQCSPCNQGDAFAAFTMVLAHEVAEAATDCRGNGWYEDSTGMENADICAWIQKQYGPWTVQGYWTNERGNTVGAYTQPSQPQPQPQPNPQPQPQPQPQDAFTKFIPFAEWVFKAFPRVLDHIEVEDASDKAAIEGWKAALKRAGFLGQGTAEPVPDASGVVQ